MPTGVIGCGFGVPILIRSIRTLYVAHDIASGLRLDLSEPLVQREPDRLASENLRSVRRAGHVRDVDLAAVMS